MTTMKLSTTEPISIVLVESESMLSIYVDSYIYAIVTNAEPLHKCGTVAIRRWVEGTYYDLDYTSTAYFPMSIPFSNFDQSVDA